MVAKPEGNEQEEKDITPKKEASQPKEKVQTYQEWRNALLENPALKVIYEQEVAKKKSEAGN